MKNIIFIPTYSKLEVIPDKIKEISKSLPLNILIAYSIQYKNQATQIKQILLKTHKITGLIQVLGCSNPKIPKNTKAVLLISDGRFHAVSLALETGLPIYIYNMYEINKISEKEIENLKTKNKARYVNYLNSKKIGILISTKLGQNRFQEALKLKKQLEKKGKEVYLFESNNINLQELENFNIDCWINTACPRLEFDFNSNKIINMNELKI